jgi:hypothetical protein
MSAFIHHRWSCDWQLDQVPADCTCGKERPMASRFMQPELIDARTRNAGKVEMGAGFRGLPRCARA